MSSEIINIYQFIRDFKASNGGTDGLIEAADKNDDGVILKHEFEDFLDSNWSGGGFPEDDIIEQFWKSIDVNKSEARIYKTDLKNYRAVTADEIDRVEKVVANYEELQGFLMTLKAPSNLSTRQQTKWLNEMKGKLTDYYNSWMTGEIKDEFALKTTYNEYVKEITPYHAAEDKMTQFVDTNSYIKSLGYDWTIDWKGTLGRNVSNHIKEYLKNNPNATGEQLVSETFKIVNAMISNADFSVSGEKAAEFKQARFTELQRIQIEDILKDDPEVMEVMSPYSSVIVDKVFNKFYSFYYNYNNSKGGNFKIAKTDAPEVFLQWFAEYGEEIIEGLGGTPVDPVTPSEEKFTLGSTTFTLNVDNGDEPQFQMPIYVYDQDGNLIDRDRIEVRTEGDVELMDLAYDGYYVTSPITSSGLVGRVIVFVDQEEVGEIDINAVVRGGGVNPNTNPKNDYYSGTVYISAIVEDHRAADAQRQVSWSFEVEEDDQIERGASLERQLEQLAMEKYARECYGEDIVEILSMDY